MLSQREAQVALEGAELVPVANAGVDEAKSILTACLEAGVPAVLGRDDHCTKGCAPKLYVMARPEDAARIAALMQARWRDDALKDGAGERIAARGPAAAFDESDPDAEPPCPACGHAAPLDAEGACAGCGLQLG